MKAEVISPFKDKENEFKRYVAGDEFKASEERVNTLHRLGFLEEGSEEEEEEEQKEPSVLDGSIADVEKGVTTDFGEEALNELLAQEAEDKNRKGVKEHIEGLLAKFEESE